MRKDKVTVTKIVGMKSEGERIAALTAYDFITAKILDEVGIDLILVGDSVGTVVAGYDTTLPVTMDQMIYHTAIVSRAVRRALVVGDMPFMSYQASVEDALRNAGRFLKDGGAEAVKLEGGAEFAETVRRIVASGIPVMGHLGLTPQSVHKFGGYKLQAVTEEAAQKLLRDAKALEEAGVFSIVLEKVPQEIARRVTLEVSVPTIGIGAGPYCDGQILVTHDMLGLFEKFRPKFVRRYAELGKLAKEACSNYLTDVKGGRFPSEEESYSAYESDREDS